MVQYEDLLRPWSTATDEGATAATAYRTLIGSNARASAAFRRRSLPKSLKYPACRESGCGGRTFTRGSTYREHLLRHENRKLYACPVDGCPLRLNTAADFRRHLSKKHKCRANGPREYTRTRS
ncbi:hypothetical protein BD626DRAFT_248222 [Schizophyllum amplum]|uniref:C2H2-type domain-containing protein n=1 Tax=Schizophyllum amplum TaxID=97359 RepID=A0A550BV90_9AGAR|nr:hypothetical protein BD626DRAFT_248222 [Auriculariopsis ampla]